MTADHASPPGDSPIDWAIVLQKHSRWLRTVIFARLGDRDETEEVFQEVSCAAVQSELRSTECKSIQAWLFQTAIRQSILFCRREGRRRKHTRKFAELHQPDESSGETNPLNWMLTAESDSLLHAGLEQLSADDRLVLLLKYAEDWNCRTIAEHLGVRETTIQTRLMRARKRLRAILNSQENQTSD